MLMTHSLEQHSEGDESEIAVDDARTGFVFEIHVRDRARRAFTLVFGEQVQRTPCGQTGSVRQQLADRDDLFVSAIEFRQVVRNGTVERQLAELDATRAEQRGDERLCQRSEIVDRVELVCDAIRLDY